MLGNWISINYTGLQMKGGGGLIKNVGQLEVISKVTFCADPILATEMAITSGFWGIWC